MTAGTRVGPYAIVGLLGAGGMGEVYRARDTRLNRDVALKVLPTLVTADPDCLARFRREAQLLAAMNHPHIAAIYELEEIDSSTLQELQGGAVYALILELVEGPTLAERIAQQPIPLREALPIAGQIAEALEAAHEQGIIHRDLKPANIKVRLDGTVKVLDFAIGESISATRGQSTDRRQPNDYVVDSSMAPMWAFVSRDGRTLLFNSPSAGNRNLWMMPVDSSAPPRQTTTVAGDVVSHSSLSPDVTHVAFVSTGSGAPDIWTQHIDGSDLRQLTNDEDADSWPVWSPDGQWIAYRTAVRGVPDVRRVRASGGAPERFPDGPSRGDWIAQPGGTGSWSVSGSPESVGVRLADIERHGAVWSQTIPDALTGNGQPASIAVPMFSPDGRSISAPFMESRDHDSIRVFDVATGTSRIAARLPFHVIFRASWVEGGKALVVNRTESIRHIVLFDRFSDSGVRKTR